ncbi:S8 family serine peptidase [Haloferula sargassicola]|uniref:Peptidase S8/S53 domain-containing protein n=1 Tax=Haloferula sargassicola TaxID=490096 RepID=A0ABP9UJ69_9BACT
MSRYLRTLVVLGFLPGVNAHPIPIIPAASEALQVELQGWNPTAGWAPARMNDITYTASNTGYAYPEPKTPVRLYLLDSAVDNSSAWFNKNPNLVFEHYEALYEGGSSSPTVDHGTKMLSIIAGSEAGIAPSTPIQVVNINLMNGTATTSTGDLANAIYKAVDYQSEHPDVPAVICCAASAPGQSYLVNAAVAEALHEGMTVVFSAGNNSASASNYTPASNGTVQGAICVGASTSSNLRYSVSNYGSAVDFYCPGQNVRCLNPANPGAGQTSLMNGTSPATAIAAGAALLELSADPEATPQELEATLKGRLAAGAISILQIPVPEDIDYDGAPNEVEAFFGTDWSDSTSIPVSLKLKREGSRSTLSFSVPQGTLAAGDVTRLAAGGYWRVLKEKSADTWDAAPTGTITLGSVVNGRVPVEVSFNDTAASASYCLEVQFE